MREAPNDITTSVSGKKVWKLVASEPLDLFVA